MNNKIDNNIDNFFNLIDSNGDGLISYHEFMFFSTLLNSK